MTKINKKEAGDAPFKKIILKSLFNTKKPPPQKGQSGEISPNLVTLQSFESV